MFQILLSTCSLIRHMEQPLQNWSPFHCRSLVPLAFHKSQGILEVGLHLKPAVNWSWKLKGREILLFSKLNRLQQQASAKNYKILQKSTTCWKLWIHLLRFNDITLLFTRLSSLVYACILDLDALVLILEHFLKFLLKCFLRASEKQRKEKTSDKFMNAWKCVPTQQKCSELCSPGRVFNRVLVHLNLHTYTPRQLLIRARNRCDVCSGNRPNSRKGNSKASHVKAESEHRSSKRRSNWLHSLSLLKPHEPHKPLWLVHGWLVCNLHSWLWTISIKLQVGLGYLCAILFRSIISKSDWGNHLIKWMRVLH